ncbi:P-loop containing nucleoside triphosphate hydrolase protein [Pelagophyceae sp. CCMP2097]|nr:P-loop containing nucleoside triphosphate hydrolase protein [Pelagophyceae sp. CCMP2097]
MESTAGASGGGGGANDAEVESLRATIARLEAGDEEGVVAELRATLEKERKDFKKKTKAKKDEKEQLMTAMEKEVETLIAEERAKFDKEKDKLEKSVVKAKKSGKTSVKALALLAKQVAAMKPELDRCRREATEQLRLMPTFSRGVADQIAARCGGLERDAADLDKKYRRELAERKRLHNLVQELRGNIRVFCRVRPVSRRERENGGDDLSECVSFPADGDIRVESNRKEKTWSFDRVFDYGTTQQSVFDEIQELVVSVLDGYNVCIFAYGQTGSGKTFTMTGPPEDRGCNLRALRELFSMSQQRRAEIKDTIKVSVMEVYNEQIRDLLATNVGKAKLEIRRGEQGNYVPDMTQVEAQSDAEVLELMAISDKHRTQASTNMNEQSSRSHMIMSVEVSSKNLRTGAATQGKLHLVDLAGSERVDKSGAAGQAMKEAQSINKSLSALGDVIAARGQGASHIPFRNSTLTHLLQDSLSQDSKTLMFCCVSPVLYNADETMCTLNFAARVNNVELGKASKNAAPAAGAPKPKK